MLVLLAVLVVAGIIGMRLDIQAINLIAGTLAGFLLGAVTGATIMHLVHRERAIHAPPRMPPQVWQAMPPQQWMGATQFMPPPQPPPAVMPEAYLPPRRRFLVIGDDDLDE